MTTVFAVLTDGLNRDAQSAREATELVEMCGAGRVTRYVDDKPRARWILEDGYWMRVDLDTGEPVSIEEEYPF